MSKICDDLRAAILQAAMQGKLTKQLPEDGNAEDLLTRIKAKKETLIESGSIKRQPAIKGISEDDIPFTIPNSWKWARVGDLGILESGFSFKSSDYKKHGVQIVRISDLGDDGILTKNAVYCPDNPSLVKFEIKTNSILICLTGSIGKMALVADGQKRYLNQRVGMYTLYEKSILDFLWRILHAESIKFDWILHKTSTNGNIRNEVILNTLVPLPPPAEQKRIVEKVDELMARVADLEKSTDALASLKKTFPGDVKASLLQAAMQGKLTKQLPEDGNAEDLLEEIKAEKEKLIAEGKIKKQKPLAPITDDEIPFRIPENWKWIRFGDINELISGTDLTPDKYTSKPCGIVYITGASNIKNGAIIKNRWTRNASRISKRGDLLLTCKGTVGTTAFLDVDEAHIARQIMAIRPVRLNAFYIKYFIEYMVPSLKSVAKSMIPGIERGSILNMAFPLPPLAEQKRIVERLDTLMQNINVVENLIASE